MMSKKAIEQPQVIIYVLFTTVLAISGLFVAYSYMGQIDIDMEISDYNLKYNALASKLINSPDCFALSKTYTADGVTYRQTDIGIIERSKITSGTLDSCTTQTGFEVIVKEVNGAFEEKIYKGEEWTDDDLYKWDKELKYFVLVSEGGTLYQSYLTLHLRG